MATTAETKKRLTVFNALVSKTPFEFVSILLKIESITGTVPGGFDKFRLTTEWRNEAAIHVSLWAARHGLLDDILDVLEGRK